MKKNIKHDKGVVGLSILLAVVVSLFIIGLLVAIFSIMGGELKTSETVTKQFTDSAFQTNVAIGDTGTALAGCTASISGEFLAFVTASNESVVLTASNLSFVDCLVYTVGDGYNQTTIDNLTYTYTRAGSASTVMNNTVSGIASAVDWFDIFVVITAMVVLILLTVMIIIAIRGSGVTGDTGGNGNIGSA